MSESHSCQPFCQNNFLVQLLIVYPGHFFFLLLLFLSLPSHFQITTTKNKTYISNYCQRSPKVMLWNPDFSLSCDATKHPVVIFIIFKSPFSERKYSECMYYRLDEPLKLLVKYMRNFAAVEPQNHKPALN